MVRRNRPIRRNKRIQKVQVSLGQVLTFSIFATIIAIILGVYLAIMISKPIRLVMNQMKLIAKWGLIKRTIKG